MKFFTVASDPSPHLDRLLDSANRQGIEIEVLGFRQPYPGHCQKLILMRDALEKLDPNEIFLFADGYDVIFLAPESEILEKFNAMNVPLLFNAEQNFMCRSRKKPLYFLKNIFKQRPYRYLNSGLYMGKAGAFLDVLNKLSFHPSDNCDQTKISIFYHENPGQIYLDESGHILSCAGGREGCSHRDYLIQNQRLFNTVTQTWPCVLHFPGGAFHRLDDLARGLGIRYPIIEYPMRKLKKLSKKYQYHRRATFLFKDNYIYLVLEKIIILSLILMVVYGVFVWASR